MLDNSTAKELNKIIDDINNIELRRIIREELFGLPDYFWRVPASSSGKYHPPYALGDGGLARHVLGACKIAKHLFVVSKYTKEEEDIIISALLLHDGYKQGVTESGHTVFEHPILMANYLRNKYSKNPDMIQVADCIASHMGQWNTIKYSTVVLPVPNTKVETMVHWCDYLASRNDIEILM